MYLAVFEPVTRVTPGGKHIQVLYFSIKTYRLILITLVEDDPGTGAGLLISAKRKTFAILKYKIKKIILTNIEHKLQTNVLKIKFYDLMFKRNSLTNSGHKLTKIKCFVLTLKYFSRFVEFFTSITTRSYYILCPIREK